jgi:DNA ligase-1
MLFKPMLAPHEMPNFKTLRYPLLASTKLDGIRATVQEGKLLSRTLKPIPNELVQDRFRNLPDGTDGELIAGVPSDDPYKRTHSIVMSQKSLDFYGDTVRLYVFDKFDAEKGFMYRLAGAEAVTRVNPYAVLVPHHVIANADELEDFEAQTLNAGYEGVMLRSMDGPYKQGRATLTQGWLLKVKRYQDAEAQIIGTYEEQANTNEAFTNELGRTARSSAKDGKSGKNQLGGFHVVGYKGLWDGVQFDVSSSSIKHDERKAMWLDRGSLLGKIITYKYFPMGADERPRHPIFKGFRSVEDL